MDYTCAWERFSGVKLWSLPPAIRAQVLVSASPQGEGSLDFRQAVRFCKKP